MRPISPRLRWLRRLFLGAAAAVVAACATDVAAPEEARTPVKKPQKEGGVCADVQCKAPACCGQGCSAASPCCEGTVCTQEGKCVPEACQGCPAGCKVNFQSCTMECAAPTCCLAPCVTDAECCAGTVCTQEGKCVPELCKGCGAGCTVNAKTCTAACSPPACCGAPCETDAQCCAGTSCGDAGGGKRSCLPAACAACGGLESACQVDDATCEGRCVAPPSCNDTCKADADCGPGAVCNQFDGGKKKCVPLGYSAACAACGAHCYFKGETCQVACSQEELTSPDGGACADCCEPCGAKAPCCEGSYCDEDDKGRKVCLPDSCKSCKARCQCAP